jgi:hypothetical protein
MQNGMAWEIYSPKNYSMKLKFVLAITLVCFYITTQAQIGKGSVWLGGNIRYNKYKYNPNFPNSRVITIRPAIGIATKENTVAGIDISYSNSLGDYIYSNGTSQQKIKTYGAGVFIRKYLPVINRLYIYGQARAGYNNNRAKFKSEYDNIVSETEQKGWDVMLDFSPGVSYAVNKKLQLETGLNNLISLQYSKMKSEWKDTRNPGSQDKTTSFSAGINLDNLTQFHLGFRLLINNKG